MVIERRIAEALARRQRAGLPNGSTNAYRLVHAAGDGIEALTVDVYDRWLVASIYSEPAGEQERALLGALAKLGFAGVYVKRRPRAANALSAEELVRRAPTRAVLGQDAPDDLLVYEHGVPFEVRLGDGLSTGLFLDQRDNRQRVRERACGARVLNLFAYTCSFGVAAALGSAASTDNLDLAKPALARGRRNYELSGLSQGPHRFLARDALTTLPKLARRKESYDLIVLDPPSYASSAAGRFRAEHDYGALATDVFAVLRPGGSLLACLNHHALDERTLVSALVGASSRAGRSIASIEAHPPPTDFPAASGRPPHLKSVWVRLQDE